MKGYIHARLSKEDSAVLKELKAATGESESQLVRRGLRRLGRQALRPRRRPEQRREVQDGPEGSLHEQEAS